MAKEWYLFGLPHTIQTNNSGFEKDEFIDYACSGFAELLERSFLTIPPVRVYYGDGLNECTGKNIKAIVQNNSTDSATQDHVRQIITYIGTLKLGMYVHYQNEIWLIIGYIGNNQIYEKSIMYKCNYKLRWINRNSEIVERWIWRQDSTRFSSGETGMTDVVIGNVRNEMLVPKDCETIYLKRDMRFIMGDRDAAQIHDPLTYRITKENGLLRVQGNSSLFSFILTESGDFNPLTDNRELMIADYWNTIANYDLDLITSENLEIGIGESFKIQLLARKDDVEVNIGVKYKSENEEIITIDENGLISGISIGNSSITIEFHNITKTINVVVVENATTQNNTCVITYIGVPTIKVGGAQKTFTATFYDSLGNKLTTESAVWSIYDNIGTQPSYIEIVSQTSNQIIIKCKNDINAIGSFINLKLTDSNNTIENILEIYVSSLT